VGIYDDKFRLQRKYDVDIDTDPNADLDVAASDPGWITDAVWMDNTKHAVYTTSLRTMHFFDASASVHYEVCNQAFSILTQESPLSTLFSSKLFN
jgi:hypothetical protein